MSRIAPRIHTDPAVIAQLEAFATQLPQGQCVAVTLDDGSTVRGVVSATATAQVFFDARGNEGLNAIVRIEDLHDQHVDHYLWLDRVRDVVRLANPSPPRPSTRRHPPDPNAPAPDLSAK